MTVQVVHTKYKALIILTSAISLLLSSTALYFAAKNESHNGKAVENSNYYHRIQKRGTNDEVTSNEGNECDQVQAEGPSTAEQQLQRMTCNYKQLKEEVDGWADEFNAVLYFINEIGVNMQAAREKIHENTNLIRSVQGLDAVHDDVNGASIYTALEEIQQRINSTSSASNARLLSVEIRTRNLLGKINAMNESLRRINAKKSSNAVETSTSYFLPGGNPELERNLNRMEQRIENFHLQTQLNRNSLMSLQNSLSNHASDQWFNAPNGYQYFLSKSAFRSDSYTRSRRYCKKMNADLAYVGMRNDAVFRFLWSSFVGPSRLHCVWIGLTDLNVEGQWKWMDGQEVERSWTNWAPGQPGHLGRNKDCGMIKMGAWAQADCSGFRKLCSFLCERKIIEL
ncbi:uncharacterized protein LOC143465480 [Clavelina lepadiformis]|uniref:uncharacterized protein LOC143465480 n=1 Tax=Clavelina lepadiformis TaxID=159417 RepID=UPI0040411401